ncbi:hypothetical protein A3K78_04890 [Candidatus Bathyarchaeota archaeon RBG_13_52_12]|nr:MAG: hypothetical protein A3K78_04890 [Candidatus Bathyarchaeota archaeon RBG_13_52_12]
MVKVNGKDVEWKRAPNFVSNVQRQVLWKDEKTGATFAILKIPEGVYLEQVPHSHPHSNQFTFRLSGEIELPNGTHIAVSEDDYGFDYCPKDKEHGAMSNGTKVLKDFVYLHYWDGPEDWNDTDKTDK